jgi:hypothetical protein
LFEGVGNNSGDILCGDGCVAHPSFVNVLEDGRWCFIYEVVSLFGCFEDDGVKEFEVWGCVGGEWDPTSFRDLNHGT